MRTLIYKEIKLVLHPMNLGFLLLSALPLVPNYPYYVMFFFTTLGVFMMSQSARENNDMEYTVTLPILKSDLVRARFLIVVLIELLQMVLALPFALLRQRYDLPGNQVGMDANIAMFAFSFVLFGIFNLVFLTSYFRAPQKVGVAFLRSNIAVWGYIILAETADHIIPFMRDQLDTPDPQFLREKSIVLAVGVLLYAAFTLFARRRAFRSFEALDLQ